MKNDNIIKGYYKRVICRLFIAGHASQGESIVFIIYGDDMVIYSCVVDSFCIAEKVAPISILERLDIQKIDEVYWTHPHDDHSSGLIKLIDIYKPETVFISNELHNLPEGIETISAITLRTINGYKSRYDRRVKDGIKIQPISCNSLIHEVDIKVNEYTMPFIVRAIAPCSGKTRIDVINSNYNSINNFSLALIFCIGDFAVLLSGDIQNNMIDYIYDEVVFEIPRPNILKIPHHGSDTSTNIIDLFDLEGLIDVGLMTAKKSSNLPKEHVIHSYKAYCSNLMKIESESTECAVWGAEIDILNASIKVLSCENFISCI